jgi:hypothetical protein
MTTAVTAGDCGFVPTVDQARAVGFEHCRWARRCRQNSAAIVAALGYPARPQRYGSDDTVFAVARAGSSLLPPGNDAGADGEAAPASVPPTRYGEKIGAAIATLKWVLRRLVP